MLADRLRLQRGDLQSGFEEKQKPSNRPGRSNWTGKIPRPKPCEKSWKTACRLRGEPATPDRWRWTA